MNFNTRDEYFAWKEKWKEDYFKKVKEIRDAKNAVKNYEREKFNKGPINEHQIQNIHNLRHTVFKLNAELSIIRMHRSYSRIRAGQLRQERLGNS